MKKYNRTEYNELCVGFLQLKSYKGSYSRLKFDTDWIWIHEVVEKIKTLNVESDEYNNLTSLSITTSKNKVVKSIWKFLIWYTKNKQKHNEN